MRRLLFWLCLLASLVIGPVLLLAGCIASRVWPR